MKVQELLLRELQESSKAPGAFSVSGAVIALAEKADYKEAMREALHKFAAMAVCELTGDAARIRDEINAEINESPKETGRIEDIISSMSKEDYERLASKIIALDAHIDNLRE